MQPKIALTYNSSAGNGPLGVGWSISGLSEIVRCPQTIATNGVAGGVNDDSNDRFCLGGQQLIAVPAPGAATAGAYGADGTHYAKEIDDFSEIISHGGGGNVASPDWFEVHTKSGLTLEYGNTSTSANSQLRSANGQVVEAWALDKVTDQASNYTTITWNVSGDVLYPAQINYAGNGLAGTSPTNQISFSWEARNDAPTVYAAGTAHQTGLRLQAIKTYVNGQLVSDYELAYQYGASTQRSEITSITKLDGSSPQNALPPLTFAWSDAQIDEQPDLITSISNGYGASIGISYLPATSPSVVTLGGAFSYPNAPTAPKISVVSQIVHQIPIMSIGAGGAPSDTTTSYSTDYGYMSPEVNLEGRGYLGFGDANIMDMRTWLATNYLYYQTFPLIGRPAWAKQWVAVDQDCVDCIDETYGVATSAQGTTFPYLANSVQTRNDIAPGNSFYSAQITGALPTITTTYTYDTSGPNGTSWGNLTTLVSSTSDGYSTTINNTFLPPNTSSWLIGLESQTNVSAQGIGQSALTRGKAFTYNNLGQITSETIQPGGAANITSTTSYTYDVFGNRTSQTTSGSDVPSATTQFGYDSIGQFATSITNALNQTESRTYDARFGTLTSDTDINGLTTSYSYDSFGRLIQKTKPDGSADHFTYAVYNTPGNSPIRIVVEDLKLGADGTTQIAPATWGNFDSVGRMIYRDTQSFSGAISRVADVYDWRGNLIQRTNPYILGTNPVFTDYTDDELGRVTTTTHPDGSVNRTAYEGQTVVATNGLGQTATIFKDGHNNVVWTEDSLGDKTTFTYDGFNERTSATDPDGNVTTYNFDIRGRAVSGSDPDKGAWTATYNSLGELIGTTDAKGQSVSMTYDPLGRMTQRIEPDLISTWTYDTAQYGIGKLASATASGVASPSGQAGVVGYTRTYTYDSLGRLMSTSYSVASGGSGISVNDSESYQYDAAGRPAFFYTPYDGFTTTYNSYGYESGVVQTSTGNPLWTATGRDAAGSLTGATYGTSVQQSFTYDPDTERMTGITATGPNNTTLESLNYTYDVLGNVTQRTTNPIVSESTPLTEWYSYDGLNRLCTVNQGTSNRAAIAIATQSCLPQPGSFYPGLSLLYDPLGDITAKTDVPGVFYSYPAGGQPHPHAVQSIGNATFTYDADGNMLTGAGRTTAYTSFNMVRSVTQNGKTITFSYGPEHQRVIQTSPEGSTLYLPDLEIVDPNSPFWVMHGYFTDANGHYVGEIDHGMYETVKFFLNDWQNSVSTITDVNGNVLEADSYDAWGKRRFLNGTADTNDTITSQTVHGYTNQEELPDVQLVDLNARMYDPYLGIMLSVDPAVADWLDPQSWNAYSYARDNPMRYTDPTGDANYVTDPAGAPPTNGLAYALSEFNGNTPSGFGPSGGAFGGDASLQNASIEVIQIQPINVQYQSSNQSNSGFSYWGGASNFSGGVQLPSVSGDLSNFMPAIFGDTRKFIRNFMMAGVVTFGGPAGDMVQVSLGAEAASSTFVPAAESAFSSYMSAAQTLDVSTAENGSVFYSGAGNRALAEEFAVSNGRTTLEMTPGGSWLDAQGLFGPSSPLTPGEATQVWSTLSGRFAAGASGNAVGFVEGTRAGGIFNSIEFPALLDNPNITNVITGGH